jgi:hypothetical protein
MTEAVIAIASLLLGVGINELVRRSNRIESYSPYIFEKRFKVYEQLWEKLQAGNEKAGNIIADDSLTAAQRHALVSEIIMDVAGYCDQNELLLNEEVAIQCCTVFMGVEDIKPELKERQRKKLEHHFRGEFKHAVEMIRAEAGLERMDKLFRSITRPKHTSDIVDFYREEKKKVTPQK